MLQNTTNLLLEINDFYFKFYVFHCDDNLDVKMLDNLKVKSEGIENGKVVNIDEASKVIKKVIEQVEKKIIFFLKFFFKNFTELKFNLFVNLGLMLHAPSPTSAAAQITASNFLKIFFNLFSSLISP